MVYYANPKAKRTRHSTSKINRPAKRRAFRAFKLGFKKARRLSTKPRYAVKKGLSANNIHCFARNRSGYVNLLTGITDEANMSDLQYEMVKFTPDNKYCILDLKTWWSQYPDCGSSTPDVIEYDAPTVDHPGRQIQVHTKDENAFKDLFTQYKITSVDTTLTPNFRGNAVTPVTAVTNYNSTSSSTMAYSTSIPNYEVFLIPAWQMARYRIDLHQMTGPELDAFLNVTKAKARRFLPSKRQTFKCSAPKVMNYGTAVSKEESVHPINQMQAPQWYRTHDPYSSPDASELHVHHYTYRLLIRRVDGQEFPVWNENFTFNDLGLGFRVDQMIHFKCRNSPRDILERTSVVATEGTQPPQTN